MESDLLKLAAINADPKVMEFFPNIYDFKQTAHFIGRMQKQYAEKGFCYFAVDKLEDNEFIGFIGLSEQTFESAFTPCIDIGWRLAQKQWNKGYATEGANRCLKFAFEEINLKQVIAICPVVNQRSERVMIKLGMIKNRTFKHPLLTDYKTLEACVLYEIEKR